MFQVKRVLAVLLACSRRYPVLDWGAVRLINEKRTTTRFCSWLETSKTAKFHFQWHQQLEQGLAEVGLGDKLKRVEHHLSHSANAFYTSGFDQALIVKSCVVQSRTVKVGYRTLDTSEIVSGLAEGDRVILSDQDKLRPGKFVRQRVAKITPRPEQK